MGRWTLAAALVGLGCAHACTGYGGVGAVGLDDDAGADAPSGSLVVTLVPVAFTIAAGATASVAVTVQRLGRLDVPVAITASGLPDAVSLASLVLIPGEDHGTLVFTATPGAAAGTYAGSVVAIAGDATASAPITVNVRPHAGAIDTSFGTGGTASAAPPMVVSGVAMQADGKLVAAGSTPGTTNKDSVLARVLADGQLDPTFGAGGATTTMTAAGVDDYFSAALPLADGRILATGGWTGSSDALTEARYTSAGALDATFGTGGVSTLSSNARPVAAALGADGTVTMALEVNGGGSSQIALTRFLASGALDTSFGSGGQTVTSTGTFSSPVAMLLLPDGRAVVEGYTEGTGFPSKMILLRYTATGALDTTFGSGGRAPVGSATSYGIGLARLADGRVVAAGASLSSAGEQSPVVVRFLEDGTPDPSFGAAGVAIGAPQLPLDPRALAVGPDGTLVVVGAAGSLAGTTLVVARVLAGGTFDATFGTSGAGSVLVPGNAAVVGAFLQGEDHVLVAASSTTTPLVLARFWL